MTCRLFEGKDHASIYQKYRLTPPEEMKNIILQYLDEKKGQPHVLAVDLGCGTGQHSRLLAPYFQEVVGIDVSEGQVEVARTIPGYSNITYRQGPAEELPFADNSVDLLTASVAAHWFDQAAFLAEASRVLKPRGCIALVGFCDNTTAFLHQDCGEKLTSIYEEAKVELQPYTSERVVAALNKLEDLYLAIPFKDKERVENKVTISTSVRNLVGFIESWSMFQTYKSKNPQAAENLLLNTQKRFLKELGSTSPDTQVSYEVVFYCVLASKPQ
ncbi:uncharacterized protein V6R79_026456 [Siganus canaliculatus]